jgi:hypothetical protein
MILGIHSNVAGDKRSFTAGHAWLSITDNNATKMYGLWPDAHPDTVDNGDKSDIRIGLEVGRTSVANRYYRLSDAQAKHFNALMKADVGWSYTHTCASWASNVLNNVVGDDIDADDWLGFETPRELGKSILALEKKGATSRISPKAVNKNPASTIKFFGR